MGRGRVVGNIVSSLVILYIILWMIFPERFLPGLLIFTVIFWFPVFLIVIFFTYGYRIFSKGQRELLRDVPKPRDSTIITRVVVEKISGSEAIIEGGHETTFREALLDDWPFPELPARTNWVVQDDASNDITDRPLSSYGGIAFIVGMYDLGVSYKDESDRYSSIDDSVVYYD